MSLRLITTLRSYAADTTRQSIDGDIPMPKSALLNIVDAMKEAADALEAQQSAVDAAAKQVLGDSVMVKPEELRTISLSAAFLRDALDYIDAGMTCREAILDAQRRILRALEAVNARDTSWH